MPIKLPKGFSRRKSSATVIEEAENPPAPSFRVFERPPRGSKSFDGGYALKLKGQGRPLSSPEYRVNEGLSDDEKDNADTRRGLVEGGEAGWGRKLTYDRASGGTQNSSSTGGLYDTSSSSARFSSTSTLPSSTDATPDEQHPSVSKPVHELPPPPPIPQSQSAFSLRAAGRTFSFGRKHANASSPGPPLRSEATNGEPAGLEERSRQRAMTESSYASGSTATPPKLLDADLDLGGSDFDGFGNMFEDFGKRRSRVLDERAALQIPLSASPVGHGHWRKKNLFADQLLIMYPAGVGRAISPYRTTEIVPLGAVALHTVTHQH